MRAALLGLALVILGLGAASTSCLVDRHSDDFACGRDEDCARFADNRECTGGYCVPMDCPDDCVTCGAGKTCELTCTGARCKSPGGVSCPEGYVCTITCTGECSPIDCSEAAGCVVLCSSAAATCGPLACGADTVPCTCAGNGTCQ